MSIFSFRSGLRFHRMTFAIIVWATTSHASADLITRATLGYAGVSNVQDGTIGVSISTSSYQPSPFISFVGGAAAQAGYLELGTSALFQTTNLVPAPTDGGATATARTIDVITPGGGPAGTFGFAVFDFSIFGTNSTLITGVSTALDPQGHIGTTQGASLSTLEGCTVDPLDLIISLAPCTGPSLTFGAFEYLNVPIQIELPVIYGQPIALVFTMSSSASVTFDRNFVEDFSGSSSFFDTAKITSVELLDADHQPISNPSLLADSGTNYPLGGTQPGTSEVPEPSLLAPLAGAFAMLLMIARRKMIRFGSSQAAFLCGENIMKPVLLLLAALLPSSLYAIDGVVLINQATVNAAGGFPYIISQPGSYKLSGNLTMNTTPTGNHLGIDIAVAINASGVVLDLNGFSILVNNTNPSILHGFFAIAETGTFSRVTVKNGNVTVLAPVTPFPGAPRSGIYLHTSPHNRIEDTTVLVNGLCTSTVNPSAFVFCGAASTIDTAHGSLIRHNVFGGAGAQISCQLDTVVVDNSGAGPVDPNCSQGKNTSPVISPDDK